MILNLDEAPDTPIERLMYLSGVTEQVEKELDAEYQKAYFEARLEGHLVLVLGLGFHSRKKVMAFTRAENEKRGRIIRRWNDDL